MRSVISVVVFMALSSPALADGVDWHALRSPSAQASSYLQTNWNRFTENYHPTYVLDEDPKTAWVEGVDGLGEGQVLTVPLSRVQSARQVRVRIRNGYQKSAGLLSANAAPNRIRLRLVDSSGTVTGQVETSLEKAMGWQEVVIPLNGAGFDHLELEVVSVHDGTRYRDTCVSDVLVDVDSDDEWSERAEAGRLQQARSWMSERVAAAQFFANQPADYPFHTGGYDGEKVAVNESALEGLFLEQQRGMAELGALGPWYSTSYTRRIEMVDSLWFVKGVLQEFSPGNLAWFEADGRIGATEQETMGSEEQWVISETARSNAKIEWADETHSRPVRLYVHVKTIEHGRGTYIYDADHVLTYNSEGRVASLYSAMSSSGDDDSPYVEEHLYLFVYDEQGKIASYRDVRRVDLRDWNKINWWSTSSRPALLTGS